ncbi:MAG TPA: dihydrodipicolinate synthase family protein, partial [Candidatus Deferrimicrobium sp.]|nr:dihydrodipicolinate synthase family protein [Candidatus Deferrimicrobium sp.]
GKMEEARNLQMVLMDSNNAVTARWGIAGLKAAMEMIGLYGGPPRLPLVSLGDTDREVLRKILTQTGFFPKPTV